jgi:peptidyl-tRNA hydrolase
MEYTMLTLPVKDPYLYILMRDDLASLNPGKAVAQGSHATLQFAFDLLRRKAAVTDNSAATFVERTQFLLFDQWQTSTPQGFGNTITKGVKGDQLHPITQAVMRMGLFAGVTNDPSYPLQDGATLHLLSLNTCGYVFGDKSELDILLRQFNLLP